MSKQVQVISIRFTNIAPTEPMLQLYVFKNSYNFRIIHWLSYLSLQIGCNRKKHYIARNTTDIRHHPGHVFLFLCLHHFFSCCARVAVSRHRFLYLADLWPERSRLTPNTHSHRNKMSGKTRPKSCATGAKCTHTHAHTHPRFVLLLSVLLKPNMILLPNSQFEQGARMWWVRNMWIHSDHFRRVLTSLGSINQI